MALDTLTNLSEELARRVNDSLPVFADKIFTLADGSQATFVEWLDEAMTTTGGGLPAGSVGTAELADGVLSADAAGRAKVAADFFDAATALAKFAADSITNAVLLKAVLNGAFVADAATRALFADDFVNFAKAAVFVSAEQTGTGAEQDIAHGLAAAPTAVLIAVTEGHDGAASQGDLMPNVAEGAHDGTNVKATVTSGARYKVLAWA